MKLVIKRSEWARGSVEGAKRRANLLFSAADNTRCCLGFLGNACGYTDQALVGYGLPSEFVNDEKVTNKWNDFLLHEDYDNGQYAESRVADDLIAFNDDLRITEPEREAKIAEIMGKHGVEVEFVD